MQFLTLRLKMILGTVAVILMVGGALGILVRYELHSRFEDEVHKRGVSIARYVAEASEIPLITENKVSLQQLVDEMRSKDHDLAYLYIVDPAKTVLVHTFGSTFPESLRRDATVSSPGQFKPFLFKNKRYYEVAVPIQKGMLGTVHLGIYETVVQNNIHGVLKRMLPFVMLIMGGGVLAALWFATAITRPIAQLIEGVKTVREGNFDTALPVTSRDEIGELAQAFNEMTDNLQRTTVTRQFMEKLINSMNDALLVLTPEGVIQNCNQAFGTLYGADTAQLMERPAAGFDEDSPQRIMFMAFQKLQEGEQKLKGYEALCRNSAGVAVPIMFSLAVMRDEQERPVAVIFAAQDISEIKEAQERLQAKQHELQQLNQHLEDMVASRTAELAITNEGLRSEVGERMRTEEALRSARDLAESASRSKSEFLANMSHEMRTPLNSIIGGSEFLHQAVLQPEEKRCLAMIHQAGETLLTLVNDLIDLSRIEAGQMELNLVPFNLVDTLENVRRMFTLTAEKKGILLQFVVPNDIPHFIIGDQPRLQQVLINLIANALKFTEAEGSVTLALLVRQNSADGVELEFSVRDTGIGIASEKLAIIFESFSQADSSITRRFGGSGLGLSISKRLIEAMGGTITVESVPGVGSTFTFLLQFAHASRAVVNRDSDAQRLEQVKEPLPGDGETKHILLVDDAVENRDLIRLLLAKQPVMLDEAEQGEQAVSMFQQKRYDLVLMDIQMPVMDGYSATRRIREYEAEQNLQHVPIVALTAHAYNEDIQKCREAGCDDHLAKPFKKKGLLACMASYLKWS